MKEKLLFITDTYKELNLKKDTSILMIEEALRNNFLVYQCELNDLFVDQELNHLIHTDRLKNYFLKPLRSLK